MKKIRVILVEDDKDIREMTEGVLAAEKDIEVVKTFSNGDNFLKSWMSVECDVVLMDINMPGKNGIDCIAIAKPQRPNVQFMVCTVFENPAYIFQALCNGATGYMLKNNTGDQLITAIHEIAQGGSPMSSSNSAGTRTSWPACSRTRSRTSSTGTACARRCRAAC